MYQSLLIFSLCLTVHSQLLPNSRWMCSNSICKKIKDPSDNQITYTNQNECRISCGSYGAIWPHPTGETVISSSRILFNPFEMRANIVAPTNETNKFIADLNKLFLSNIAKECIKNCSLENGAQVFLKLSVNSSSMELNWDTNESYILRLRSTEKTVFIDIKSKTVFGIRHGLETLSNIITGNSNGNGLVTVAHANVIDEPKFKHRGLLIDTSRNFLSLKVIKSVINGMSTNKMNVLHWHATDSQSFPMEFPRVPLLHTHGSYSPNEVYTQTDVKNLIMYAKLRGVRVLIEIDGPSHSSSGWGWGPNAGLGNLTVCMNKQPWRKFCIQPPCGLMNPINPNVYDILKKVYQDLIDVIPKGETVHMGGDEVFIPCWNSTEEITTEMKNRGLDLSESSFLKIWSEFHKNNVDNLFELTGTNIPVIVWSSHLTKPEIIQDYLPKDRFIIQTWVENDKQLNTDLIKLGYNLIISTKNAWYLDHGFWGKTQFYNWKTVYNNKILKDNLVLGGEVCMWGEYVDDYSIEQKIWPRAAAAAERLWSDPESKADSAEERFNILRYRLITRGIHPDAITPKWCSLNERECQ